MAVGKNKHPLGKILVHLEYASVDQVKEALKLQKEVGGSLKLGQALRKLGYCNDIHIARALSKQQGVPFVDLADYKKIPQEVYDLMRPEQVEEHKVIPVQRKGNTVFVASSEVLDYYQLDNLRFIFGTEVSWVMASPKQLAIVIQQVYNLVDIIAEVMDTDSGQDKSGGLDISQIEDDIAVDAEDDDGIVAQLVQTIISDAITRRASDIHVEPMEDKLRIRYRVDGECIEMECPPKRLQGSVLSRIKILAGMDIAEKRKPQDGRIKIAYEGRDIDLRVSALPCTNGESVVMRILDAQKNLVSIEQLGMHPSDFERFRHQLSKPNGVFLVTGPTGSGKTTTLYAGMQMLNKPDVKIITAEDPVEYNISGINQSQVRHNIGLSFARILRAMLRQAPNIVLVGEIRDQETADIAIEASLTGHLVFSTLHTNDAPSSLTRLINMGVKPFLVASAVQGILAQRLIRRLCPHCKRPYEPTDQELSSVGLTREAIVGKTFYEPVGCDKCGGNGYRGRMGVYELLEMNIAVRELVFKGADGIRLRHSAIENGMTTLQQDGVRKVMNGVSTFEEVLGITHDQNISN